MKNGHRIVTLEEHFATPESRSAVAGSLVHDFEHYVYERLSDIEKVRLPDMDTCGIDIQVLSQTSPGIQGESDIHVAAEMARRSNDYFAAVTAEHPDRFSAFASIPTQDPVAAVNELKRAVLELGFKGTLINGHTNGSYLDDPRYDILWSAVADLGVPIYLHPTFSPTVPEAIAGIPALGGSAWGWAFETASHALRIMASGVFDKHPSAMLMLGHMGEGLPFTLDRLDDRFGVQQHTVELELRLSDYFRRNVWITTSGVENSTVLTSAIDELGSDRILFAVDYPYQYPQSAVDFICTVPISEDDRRAITHENATKLLGL